MKKLCIIVINYFSYKNTEACLQSLINQPFDTLYLIDNSNDCEQEKLTRELGATLKNSNIKFDVVVSISQTNLGFGTAINNTIKKDIEQRLGHENYLLLNNDTILPKNTIKTLSEEKQKRPNVGLLSPQIDWNGDLVSYRGYNKYLGHGTSPNAFLATPYLTGCCLLVDHSLTNAEYGLFDPDFFMYGEDIWLNWKAKKMGKEIFCTNKITIFHEGSGSSNHGDYFYEYHVVRGHVLLDRKIANNNADRMTMFIGTLIYLPARAIIRSIRFRSLVPLKAALTALFQR